MSYDDIWKKGRKAILSGKVNIDKHLLDVANDNRLGIALIAKVKGECKKRFSEVMDELIALEPDQFGYRADDLHVTVFDFIPAADGFVLDTEVLAKIKDVLCRVDMHEFDIRFRGIVASDGAVIACGDSKELNTIRERIRSEMKKVKLENKERYKIDIAHSSILRFRKKLRNGKKFVEKVESMRDLDLGVVKVEKLYLVVHDWYNHKEKTKILAVI